MIEGSCDAFLVVWRVVAIDSLQGFHREPKIVAGIPPVSAALHGPSDSSMAQHMWDKTGESCFIGPGRECLVDPPNSLPIPFDYRGF
jgi:hypothetical protein